MMAHKPAPIDDRSKFVEPLGISPSSTRGAVLSPRWHFQGEIPPDLSPLDAFAAQSRLLAQQLEESAYGERRMSRLPHHTIANSLSPARPGYFRSPSSDKSTATAISGQRTRVETAGPRPSSIHPPVYIHNDVEDTTDPNPHDSLLSLEQDQAKDQTPPIARNEYRSVQRDTPPPQPQVAQIPIQLEQPPLQTQPQTSLEPFSRRAQISLSGIDSLSIYDRTNLAPPSRSPLNPRSPSPLSLCTESSDDDQSVSSRRPALDDGKCSGDGYCSTPISPSENSLERTSSISSDPSFCATGIVRSPAFNFSRPISRTSASRPFHDPPSRQPSSDNSSLVPVDDMTHASISAMHKTENDTSSTSVDSKLSLPRGKMLQRNSIIFLDGSSNHLSIEVPNSHKYAPTLPPTRQSLLPMEQGTPLVREISPPSLDIPSSSTNPGSSSRPPPDAGQDSTEEKAFSSQRPNTSSMESTSTIKARSQHSFASSADCSASEHVERAIEYHNAGELNKSTYHLRLAARMSDPTGMLLYALACRHGWGMRPNPREGVAWLRRAVDEAGLEVADDQNMMQTGKKVDFSKAKAKKAQFALGIYELGVSHMNGWGIEPDKALALRCFEIAGSWGDADAMAEAGFCYAQGIGCKKDLKKSAKFYRMAEARGVNMIGNSWIYKAKYNDDIPPISQANGRGRSNTASSKSTTASADKRHKSRTRGIFSRSKVVHS